MFSLISSLISNFSQMEVINATLVVCGCLVFGAVEIKRLLRSKPGEKLADDIMDIVPWKKLPDDVIEMIVPHLSVRDRIRLSSVCKPWSSVPMRTDIPSAQHQLPWLILPQSCHSYLSFFDLCEGKVDKLDLPEPVQGGWFQGSSKGWMIMIKEKDLDSTMFLVNPISGAQHQLPPLSTTPSFQSFVDTTAWKRYGASAFCYSVVLSTSDINSDQFMVAATFGDTLCLCRLGDTRWRFIEVLDENEGITDLLFSSGKLYALLVSDNKIGVISAPRTLKCGDHVLELQLVYDKKPRTNDSMEEYADYLVQLQGTVSSRLVESTTKDEILLIHQVQDIFAKWNDNHEEVENVEGSDDDDDDNDNEEDDNLEGNEEGGEEVDDMGFGICTIDEDDHDRKLYLRTSDFFAYKLHPKKNKIAGVNRLGDQLLFLSTESALSLPATDINNLKGNCIYFATNNLLKLHPRTYTSREIGVFSFDGRKIRRSFPSVEMSVRSRLCWFTPNL